MLIGLSGVARSGKTTLATAVSKSYGKVTYIPSRTISSTKKPIVGKISLQDRIEAQNEILKAWIDLVKDLPEEENFVIDRTPFDFIAYLLCDVNMTNSKEFEKKILQYMEDCKVASLKYLDIILLLNRIDGVYVEEEGKAPRNDAYNMHYSLVLSGLLNNYSKTYHLEVKESLLSKRIDIFQKTLDSLTK